MATLLQHGWSAPEPDVWVAPDHTVWHLAPKEPGQGAIRLQELQQAFAQSIETALWSAAATRWQGKGLEGGVVLTQCALHT